MLLHRKLVFVYVVLLCVGFYAVDPTSAADVDNEPAIFGLDRPFEADETRERYFPDKNYEPFGSEDFGSEDHRPRIPEPMVFDLVRPLGAKKGELEINVLGVFPMYRRAPRNPVPDPIGLVSPGNPQAEWAPEIEFAIFDGFSLEFELPFDEHHLAAYKGAAQLTFGTAFDQQFIHGAQTILLYDRDTGNWSPTLLYLAGVRFDKYWSMLGMMGVRTEINGEDTAERTESLFNLSIFRDITDDFTAGIESNLSQSLSGTSTLFLMPQIHYEITNHLMIQTGAGLHFTNNSTIPEAAGRLIYSF